MVDMTYSGLLPAEAQKDASLRGLLGLMTGIGAASGPSPAPLGIGSILAQGANAGLAAMDASQQRVLQQGLLGAQIGKLQQEAEQKRQMQIYIQSLPPEARGRAMLAFGGMNPDQVKGGLGTRPWNITQGPAGFENAPGSLDAIYKQNWSEYAPRTALDVISSFGKYHPPVPITAGGGFEPAGATPAGAQGILRQLAPGGFGGGQVSGGQASNQLRGDAGGDMLGMVPPATSENQLIGRKVGEIGPRFQNVESDMRGLEMKPTQANVGGFQLPEPQGRQRLAPSKDAPGTQQGSRADHLGKFEVENMLKEADAEAVNAYKMRNNIAQARQALDNGLKSGLGMGFWNDIVGGALITMGMKPETAAEVFNARPGDSKVFANATGQMTMDALGGRLGAQISDADRAFIQKLFPTISTDPNSARMLMRWMEWKTEPVFGYYDALSRAAEEKKSMLAVRREHFSKTHAVPDDLIAAGYGAKAASKPDAAAAPAATKQWKRVNGKLVLE